MDGGRIHCDAEEKGEGVVRYALRDYQIDAEQRTRIALRTHRRVLVVSPTGSGKSVLAASNIESAVNLGGRVLVLAHRMELIEQLSEKLDAGGVGHGIMMGKHRREDVSSPVQVASIQTLIRRVKPPADVIVIDEAHRSRAESYEACLSQYPHAKIIGYTATPVRLDGRGLDDSFDEMVIVSTPAKLMAAGHLVGYTGFAYKAIDTSRVKKRGGDYDEAELGRLAMSDEGMAVAGDVVAEYLAHARGKRAICFCPTTEHSAAMAALFRKAGVRSTHIDHTTELGARKIAMANLRGGAIDVLCNVAIATEGVDVPELEVVILMRSTLSEGMALQMIGRGLRPAPCEGMGGMCGIPFDPRLGKCPNCGTPPEKLVCRIHDHANIIANHGRPDDEREWSLEGRPKKRGEPPDKCPTCRAYLRRDGKCPNCDYHAPPLEPEKPEAPKEIRFVDAERIDINDVQRERGPGADKVERAFMRSVVKIAFMNGHDPFSATFSFERKFHHKPTREQFSDAVHHAKTIYTDHDIRTARERYVAEKAARKTTATDMLAGIGPPPSGPHAVLGLAPNASPDAIKTRYRELAHEHHPDKGGDTERMTEINAAYEKLTGG